MPDVSLGAIYASKYREGYYVNSTTERGFFWDHEELRCIINVDSKSDKKASRLLRSCPSEFEYTLSRSSSEVLDLIETTKKKIWFSSEVRSIYEHLLAERYAFTVEVWAEDTVVGGLFGVANGRTLTLDTMAALPKFRSASKGALCTLLKFARRHNVELLDVEVAHASDHPSARLGEYSEPFDKFALRLTSDEVMQNDFILSHIGSKLAV